MMRTIQIGLVAGLVGLPSLAFAQVINPNPTLIQFGTLQAVGSSSSVSSYRGQFVDRGRNSGVRDKPRGPGLEPVNVRLGAFTLRPTIDYDSFQTDNAKRANTNGQSDMGYVIRPRMTLSSNWSRNAIELGAGVAGTVYQDFSTEDSTEVELQA
ncbi:MAG: outer membrane beta-barrel protein, partial [Hyphomonadaceae bacterium]